MAGNRHLTARRLQLEADILAAIAANGGRMTSKALGERFGTTHEVMSKRLTRMQEAGIVVRLGIQKYAATWADAADPRAREQAAKDQAAPRSTADRSARRLSKPEPSDFINRVVPASTRKVPQRLGVRSVFELGARV